VKNVENFRTSPKLPPEEYRNLEWNQSDDSVGELRLLGTDQRRRDTLSSSNARCCSGVGVVMICIVV
jgi:hypothetical protein